MFTIIRSTAETNEATRRQEISQAPELILESAEHELDDKLSSLILPTMTFLMFGSLSIIGVIGLSPLFGMVGMSGMVDIRFYIFVSAALISIFYSFTLFIGRQRPAIIPPPNIPSEILDIPPEGKTRILGREISALYPATLIGLAISIPGFLHYFGYSLANFNTLWFVWAIASTISIYGHLRTGSRIELRKKAEQQTRDWAAALNTIGSRMVDEEPMKESISEASEMMPKTDVGKQLNQIVSRKPGARVVRLPGEQNGLAGS